ncbi:MAG: DUF4389 domain-containing protein [Actinobacteria bacterium]|nr:DUF4389 domain-containing protein [Actinomycetota bacterium]
MSQVTIDSPQPYLVVESPYELPRWRPLVNWVLYIPHAVILYGLQILANVVFFVYWLMLIFTGTLHPGMFSVMAMYERYNTRATGFLLGYSETYPPFDFTTTTADNGAYPPVRLTLPAVPESVPRSAALNVFKAIPHYFVLMFFFIGAAAVAIAAWFAVLFTGAWPAGMRAFLVRVANYYYRVWTYVTMVDNTYPKFGLPPA